jgi:hypothetical protein
MLNQSAIQQEIIHSNMRAAQAYLSGLKMIAPLKTLTSFFGMYLELTTYLEQKIGQLCQLSAQAFT